MADFNNIQQLAEKSKNFTCDEFLESLNQSDKGAVYYRFLYLLSEYLKPQYSVELGVCTGKGSACIAAGSPNGTVWGVDPEPWKMEDILNKYKNIVILKDRSDSPNVLNMFQPNTIDLCYIDSLHVGEYTTKEVNLWIHKLKPGGVFVFDDIWLNSSMNKFWDKLTLPKLALTGLHVRGDGYDVGFGVAIK